MNRAPLRLCEYRKDRKTLLLASEFCGMPQEIEIESEQTGRVVRFVVDHEAAVAAEFWDGEECHYRPTEPIPNVDRLIISHLF